MTAVTVPDLDTLLRSGVRQTEGRRAAAARQAAAVAQEEKAIAAFALTLPEQLLLTTVADLQREQLIGGTRRSVESRSVSWRARKSQGWAAATARRRLVKLGFIQVSGNGYLYLTPSGWAIVHAIESRR